MNEKNMNADRIVVDYSDLGISEVPLVGRYTYTHAHPPLRQHLHEDAFEMCVLQHGRQPYVIGKKRFELTAGDMLITHPGVVHGTASEPEYRGRLYWLQLMKPSPGRLFLGLSSSHARLLFDHLDRLPSRPYPNCDILFTTFERLLASPPPSMPKPLLKASIENLLLRLLLDILSLAGRSTHQSCSPAIQRALAYLSAQVSDSVSLQKVARAAGTSESYLKVHFSKEIGMTPMEHLMWLRIEKAKRHLQETKEPITELAFRLGFLTSQHFATVFKRLTGVTPKDYRAMSTAILPSESEPAVGAGPHFHPTKSIIPKNIK